MSARSTLAFYEVLGVSPGTSTDEIELAWQRLARKFHPDISQEPDALERFKTISWAYAEVGRNTNGQGKGQKTFRARGRLGSLPPLTWDQIIRERLQAEWSEEIASRPEPTRHWWRGSSRHP